MVFIHNNLEEINFVGKTVSIDDPLAVEITRFLITSILARIAVPLFFFTSSYLLFKKNDPYPVLLKKKIRSLAVPYFLWNALLILIYFLAQQIPFLKQYFATVIISELDLKGLLKLFIVRNGFGVGCSGPLIYQFWFVRDLFLCVVFSPIIKRLFKRLPLFSLVAVFLFFQSDLLYRGIRTAAFYFSLGCLAARFDLTYKNIERIRFTDIGLLFALIVALRFYFHFSSNAPLPFLSVLSILIGGILLLKISGIACKNERIFARLKYLAGFSFWVYATHGELIVVIKKLWAKFLPLSGAWLFAEYFGGTALCVALCLLAAVVIKKVAPRLYALFTGNRA